MANTLTIVFRGLLVFHQLKVQGKPKIFEIGILPERHHHVPRIMTIRNGVLESTKLLLDNQGGIIHPGVWQLEIDQPVTVGATTRQSDAGEKVDRIEPAQTDDFRLILNLANSEFPYGDLTGKLKLEMLPVVLKIPAGEFYTRLSTQRVERQELPNGPFEDFGIYAGVMGCDIQLNGAGAKLVGPGRASIFEFKVVANTIYEFSNSPSDIETRPAFGMNHFLHYYDLFKDASVRKFKFTVKPAAAGPPGPNPALCGKGYIGESDESLKP